MADTFTPHYNLVEPQVGGDPDTWGGLLNGNFATIDTVMYANSVATQFAGSNKIVNGFMQIQQRAIANSISNGQNYSGPDRWKIYNANSGATINQVGTNFITYNGATYQSCRQTILSPVATLSSGNGVQGIYTQLEGGHTVDLNNGPCVLSFLFNTNVSGQYSVSFRTSDGTTVRSFVHTFTAVANTPQRVAVPITALGAYIQTGNPFNCWVSIGALNTGTLQTSTLDAWQTGTLWSASGNVNWGATNGNYIEASAVVLEPGVQPSAIIIPDISVEAMRCQRYWRRINVGTFETYGASGQNCVVPIPLSVPLRAAPTVSIVTAGSVGGAVSAAPTFSVPDLQMLVGAITFTATNVGYFSGYVVGLDSDG